MKLGYIQIRQMALATLLSDGHYSQPMAIRKGKKGKITV